MWQTSDIEDIEYDNNMFCIPQYNIQLANVGNGTATNIRYEWDFDIEFYLAKIYEKISLDKIDITYEVEKNG